MSDEMSVIEILAALAFSVLASFVGITALVAVARGVAVLVGG